MDHLSSLNIGNPPPSTSSSPINPLFGNIDQSQQPESYWKSFEAPNNVYINNIDQFLRENTDKLEFIDNKLNKNGPLSGDVFIDKKVLQSAWARVMKEVKYANSRQTGALSNDDGNVDHTIRNLILKEYLSKYFSVIKYDNPLQLVWKMYLQWEEERIRGQQKIHEISTLPHGDDEDEMMIDDEPIQTEQQINDGMSHYGSYYGDEHPWDQYHHHQNLDDGDINMDY